MQNEISNQMKNKFVFCRGRLRSSTQNLPLLGVIENEFDAVAVAVVDFTGVILFVFIAVAYGV